MTTSSNQIDKANPRKADWELDFYSRPILEADGKKRWELLIISSPELSGAEPFKWEKRCPAGEVNSIWLSTALKEALKDAQQQGWEAPLRLRCWRTSMKSMVKRAIEDMNIEIVPSRRTYALVEWMAEREKNLYPSEQGYMAGPLAPPPAPILNQPLPLPEAIRGDAWSWASLSIGMLREAAEWPMEFNGLLPIKDGINDNVLVPGLRMFSRTRSLALAGWLGGLEPVKLVVVGTQLILEAGQDDRWLVTDLDRDTAKAASMSLSKAQEEGGGLQFIAVQATPNEELFSGFWMLRDVI